jgi:hypothetical protein
VAAVGGITSGVAAMIMDIYDSEDYDHCPVLLKKVQKARNYFEKALVHIKGVEDETVASYHARRLVEMTTDVILGYLLMRSAKHNERKMKLAEIFIARMLPRVEGHMNYVVSDEKTLLNNYKAILS